MTNTKLNNSLFIFRRDLRLQDNTALDEALTHSKIVIPVFIFDERQLGDNPYKSTAAIEFMLESLAELNSDLNNYGSRLYCFKGVAEKIFERLINEISIDAIFLNTDYTPFSRMRDDRIKQNAIKTGIKFFDYHDALLHPPGTVIKDDGKPYTVYTPFAKKARSKIVPKPKQLAHSNFYTGSLEGSLPLESVKILASNNENLHLHGGRSISVNILKSIATFKKYEELRNLPAQQGTTNLSAHLKFGTVSAREVYHQVKSELGSGHGLITELLWRDFFTHIAFHFPHVFKKSFHKKYEKLRWSNDTKAFQKWCDGQTGFPIVDAGMRQLNTTGYMHNRVRMIVASFLVKDLHINWRWGEKYFATRLIDYDPAVNNGNWQWAASTGCDAQPYFRIFNPWLQQKKFDPECEYIYRWVPELKGTPPKILHKLFEGQGILGYPTPMVDHSVEKEIAEEMYRISH